MIDVLDHPGDTAQWDRKTGTEGRHVMKIAQWIAPATLAVAAGTALAGFEIRSVDAGSLGSGITGSADFYQSNAPGAGPRPPSPETIEASGPNNSALYDSYVAIDVGPSVGGDPNIKGDGFHANPGDLLSLGNNFPTPNHVGGVWFMDPTSARPEVASIPNPLFGGAHALFIARLTFRSTTGTFPNETLSVDGPNGLVVDIRDPGTVGVGSPATDSLLVRFTAFAVGALGSGPRITLGLDGGSLDVHPLGNEYELREVVTLAGPLPGGTARWQVHDLYVVEVPAPGSLSLLACVGIVGVRRRRIVVSD